MYCVHIGQNDTTGTNGTNALDMYISNDFNLNFKFPFKLLLIGELCREFVARSDRNFRIKHLSTKQFDGKAASSVWAMSTLFFVFYFFFNWK